MKGILIMAKKSPKLKKIFVLDTNVFIYDPSSIFRFKDHDVFLPIATLEELDSNKKGTSDVARNCRQASRNIDDIMTKGGGNIHDGFGLSFYNGGAAKGKLFIQSNAFESTTLPFSVPTFKGDNEILRVTLGLKAQYKETKEIVLVSKDINLRIKATTMGLCAEDYFNDKVLEDSDVLHTGVFETDEHFWNTHQVLESGKSGTQDFYVVQGPAVEKWYPNMLILSKDQRGYTFAARVKSVEEGKGARIESIRDYCSDKNKVWGIHSKNIEQSFALNLLLDPSIHFMTILGQAGSGKTMLTLAAGLELLFDKKLHNEMIFTRITVPVGEEIGYLPGGEEEKMAPWMGALYDNLEVLTKPMDNAGDWGKKATEDLIGNKIKIKSMAFMRGRTFVNKILVIDEAQNLTPKQMKTLITRAGFGTKVICLGNLAQIDTPYLTETSCGLAYAVERMKGWEHAGHVTLAKVERSALADYASRVL